MAEPIWPKLPCRWTHDEDNGIWNTACVTFRDSVSAINSGPDFWGWKQQRMNWSEGRHGDSTRITIKHEAETQVDEQAAPGVDGCKP